MKILYLTLILTLFVSCVNNENDKKKIINFPDTNNHLRITTSKIDSNELEKFLKQFPFAKTDKGKKEKGDRNIYKISLNNQGNDMFVMNQTNVYYEIVKSQYDNKLSQNTSCHGLTKVCKMTVKKSDSLSIYIDYTIGADTLFMPIFWKRENMLGTDEIKFYATANGEIKYHSCKQLDRGDNLLQRYKIFESCEIYESKHNIIPLFPSKNEKKKLF